jgi:riboflavin kinase / FMN adenylyltransferase
MKPGARIEDLPRVGEAAVCMGVFDGVHRGHLALVAATVGLAHELHVKPVALVFDPHPEEVVRPGMRVARLAPVHENLRRLREAGIEPVPLRFDEALRSLAAEEFLECLAPAITVRGLVMTPESAFGRNRAGTPEAMQELGRLNGFAVRVIDRLLEAGEPISSGRIRQALADAELTEAAALLGHPPYLEGSTSPEGVMAFTYRPALPRAGAYEARIRGAAQSLLELRIGPDQSAKLVGGDASGRIALDLLGAA